MDENIEKHRNDFAADVSKQHLASLPPYNEKSLRSEDDWKKYEEEYEKFRHAAPVIHRRGSDRNIPPEELGSSTQSVAASADSGIPAEDFP